MNISSMTALDVRIIATVKVIFQLESKWNAANIRSFLMPIYGLIAVVNHKS